jgi:hypothetical protein
MKKLYFLLPFVLLSCKSAISTINQNPNSVSKPVEVVYKVDETEVS